MWYYIYENATNRLIADSSEPIPGKEGFTVISFAERQLGMWNEQTLSFDPIQPNKRFKKHDFFKKVGLTLFDKTHLAAETDQQVASLLRYLDGMETVNLEDPELVYGLNLLVTKGVWTEAEKDGVLNV